MNNPKNPKIPSLPPKKVKFGIKFKMFLARIIKFQPQNIFGTADHAKISRTMMKNGRLFRSGNKKGSSWYWIKDQSNGRGQKSHGWGRTKHKRNRNQPRKSWWRERSLYFWNSHQKHISAFRRLKYKILKSSLSLSKKSSDFCI